MAKGKTLALDIAIGATLSKSFSATLKKGLKGLSEMGPKGKAAASALAVGAGTAAIAFKATAAAIEKTVEVCDKAVEAAGLFEQQMANVSTLLSGTSEEVDARTEELSQSVLEISNATGVATENLTDGLYQVISAYGDSADAAAIMELAAKSGAAGMATTTDAVNLLSAVTKAYGDTSLEANQKVSDMAFQTVKLGQTTYAELADSVQKVTSMSKAMGVTQEEMFGVFAAGTGVIGNAAEVGTKLKAVYTKLQKPTKEMSAAFESLGYASGEAMIADLGLQGTLDALTKYSDEAGVSLAKLYGSSNAAQLATAMTGDLSGALSSKTKAMGEAGGSTDAAFARQTQTYEYSMQMLKNFGNNALIELGQKLIPYLTDIGTRLLPIVSKLLDKLLDGVDQLLPFISELFESIDLSAIMDLVVSLIPPLMDFLRAILPIASQLISALVPFISQLAATLLPVLSELIQTLLPVLMPIIEPLLGVVISLLPAIVSLVNAVTPFLTFVGSYLGMMASLLNMLMPIISGILSVVLNVIAIISNVLSSFFTVITDTLGGIFDSLSEKVKTGVNFVIRCINAVINAINKIQIGPLPNWKILGEYAGASIGFNLHTIPELATGGVVTEDTVARIGEGREPEAVLPLSRLESMLSGGIGGGEVNITFAPVINVENGDPRQIEEATENAFDQFTVFMERYIKQNRRVQFSQ